MRKIWRVEGLRVIGAGPDGSVSELLERPLAGPIPVLSADEQREQAMTWAAALNDSGLSRAQVAVLDVIRAECAAHDGACSLSKGEIAARAGVSRPWVVTCIAELGRLGLLVRAEVGYRSRQVLTIPVQAAEYSTIK